jgi:peptidoglycan/LPS O-acetylase OafA/YrhL
VRAFDRLRTAVILLVVVHHSMIAYARDAVPWWYVRDRGGVVWFEVVVLINDTFMMPALFFVAGCFFPTSAAQGGRAFVSAKVRRLLIPLGLGALVVGPVISYVRALGAPGFHDTYLDFWLGTYLPHQIEQFHYWFLGVLFVFFAAAWILRRWFRWGGVLRSFVGRQLAGMRVPALYALAVLLAILSWLVTMQAGFDTWMNLSGWLVFQPSRIPLYAGFFILGIAAGAAQWKPEASALPRLRVIVPPALVLAVGLVATMGLRGRMSAEATTAFVCLLHPLIAMSMLLVLLRGAVVAETTSARLGLDDASFGIYLLHLPMVVVLQYWLLGMPLGPWLKMGIVSSVALTGSYLLTRYGLKRIAVARAIV